MQQFSFVYNNLFVFLEPVDEPRPTYDCGQLMQGSSSGVRETLDRVSVPSPIAIDMLMVHNGEGQSSHVPVFCVNLEL